MSSTIRRYSVAASLAVLALSACRETSSPVAPELASARRVLTPPPPPLDNFDNPGGGGFTCDPDSPPEILPFFVPLPAIPRLIASGSGNTAMLQLDSQTDPSQQRSEIQKGAFLQERNGSIVPGRGKFTILPFGSYADPLSGDLSQATGALTMPIAGGKRMISVEVPVRTPSGDPVDFVCTTNPNVIFRVAGASILLTY